MKLSDPNKEPSWFFKLFLKDPYARPFNVLFGQDGQAHVVQPDGYVIATYRDAGERLAQLAGLNLNQVRYRVVDARTPKGAIKEAGRQMAWGKGDIVSFVPGEKFTSWYGHDRNPGGPELKPHPVSKMATVFAAFLSPER